MRIEPVKAYGRTNMRRKRPSGDKEQSSQEERTSFHPPVPVEPVIERVHEEFIAAYLPNAAFMTHLIATRENEIETIAAGEAAQSFGSSHYRQTAASPRRRRPGHVITVDF